MPISLQDMFERRRELAAELATLDREIEAEALRLASKTVENAVHTEIGFPEYQDMTQRLLEQEGNQSRKASKSKRNSLKPPKPHKPIDFETIVSSIYEARPETKGYDSERLLAYIKDFGRKQGIVIDITAGRIRKLQAWKDQAPHRKSGSIRYGYDLSNVPGEKDD